MQEKQQGNEQRYDRIKGCMYGVAIGDCLGAPVEFMSAEDIRKHCGWVKDITDNLRLGVDSGIGTDDTAMTLAVAEGLMRAKPSEDPVESVGREFVRWFNGDPIGLGTICGHSISYASKHGYVQAPTREMWFEGSARAHDALNGRSAGNGSLMRTAPVALLSKGRTMRELAYDISGMTHYDPEAGDACFYYCEIISRLIRGQNMRAVIPKTLVKTIYEDVRRIRPKPTGYVVDSFRTAIWGAMNTDSFERALEAVINQGGDADTTGAICGGLVGAAYGFSAIPDRWVGALDRRLTDRLDVIVGRAAKVWRC